MERKFTKKLSRQSERLLFRTIICSLLLWLSLVSCRTETTSLPSQTSPPTDKIPPATVAPRSTEQVLHPTLTTTFTPEADPTSSATATQDCVQLFYEEYAQVELISPQGVRVLLDVYDPGLLSNPANEGDILLTTHTHWDHVNNAFQESFPGRQLMTKSGVIDAGDVRIQGIPSAHNVGDLLVPEGGTNYIYVVEMGGLRIAHFGDIGQDVLTSEQLDALGQVDVAITQLANSYSDMSAENQKGLKLMEQVGPKLIIPTHLNLDAAKLAVARWQGLYIDQPSVTICSSDLMEQTSILLMGEMGRSFAERLNLVNR